MSLRKTSGVQQETIRIAIMDDHRVFSEALSRRLSEEPDFEVVGTAGSFAEAVDLFLRQEIDVVTLELEFGGKDGLAMGRRLAARSPDLGIVVVTAAADDDRVCEAVEMGVRGWVAKQSATTTLLTAIRGAARGETFLPAALLTRAMVSLSEKSKAPTAQAAIGLLSSRELDVLRCLMDGLSRSEISGTLNISRSTVATHIQSILHKLNVHSALTAVAFARRAGVVSNREYAVIPPKLV